MGKKILVVIDMQNDFITGPLGNEDCRAVVEKVVAVIKNSTYDMVCFTYDTHQENYMTTNEGKHLPVLHCIAGTEGWKLDRRVNEAADELEMKEIELHAFSKPTFGSVDLQKFLQNESLSGAKNEANTVIDFCGVCTGICVISNAMLAKAALPEATVRVLADACACVTPETHKTALSAMKLCQIEIINEH